MTTQELHVGINLELQELNTFADADVLPQELDWFINKEVLKYINKKLSPDSNVKQEGFEDTTKRLVDLKELVKTSPVLYAHINDEGNGIVSLPSDLYIPIRTDVMLAKDCVKIINAKETLYRTEIKIDINADILTSFKVQITTIEGLQTIFNYTELPEGYLKSIDFKKQVFMLHKALKIKLNTKLKTMFSSPFNLYWEFDRNDYIPNTFVLYTKEQVFNSVVTFNGIATNSVTTSTIIDKYSSVNYPLNSKVRLIDDEFFSDNKNSHLSKSSFRSLIGRVYGNLMQIDKIQNVVIGGVKITYICKPLLADLLLNSNINMSDNSLNEILVNTVAYIKNILSSQSYDTYKKENILIE